MRNKLKKAKRSFFVESEAGRLAGIKAVHRILGRECRKGAQRAKMSHDLAAIRIVSDKSIFKGPIAVSPKKIK